MRVGAFIFTVIYFFTHNNLIYKLITTHNTRYKTVGVCDYSSISARFNNCVILTGTSFATQPISYRKTLPTRRKDSDTENDRENGSRMKKGNDNERKKF
jgi:hypothetical protein